MNAGDISHEQALSESYILLLKAAYRWDGPREWLL
jgi:hypothetical protein